MDLKGFSNTISAISKTNLPNSMAANMNVITYSRMRCFSVAWFRSHSFQTQDLQPGLLGGQRHPLKRRNRLNKELKNPTPKTLLGITQGFRQERGGKKTFQSP